MGLSNGKDRRCRMGRSQIPEEGVKDEHERKGLCL